MSKTVRSLAKTSLTWLRQKIDTMREEVRKMRESLDAVLAERQPRPKFHEVAPSVVNPSTVTPVNSTSPAGLSTREDNTQMAMTRENSLEPAQGADQGNGAVTVEEPMSSLFEVTRLRNIRSNKANTARPLIGPHGELNDFISRGVIAEHEAEELYKA